MIELYFFMHYVVYKFYRKHNEEPGMSMLYSSGLHILLLFATLVSVLYIIGVSISNLNILHVFLIMGFILLFEYFSFFKSSRFLAIFDAYDLTTETPKMKLKIRVAKYFNFVIILFNLLMLVYADYCNHH